MIRRWHGFLNTKLINSRWFSHDYITNLNRTLGPFLSCDANDPQNRILFEIREWKISYNLFNTNCITPKSTTKTFETHIPNICPLM